jgi:hypothetical protein
VLWRQSIGQIFVETTRCWSRWTIASDVVAMGKLMMTAVRSDAAMRTRHFRIIVVMGWITHAANMAGSHIPPSRSRLIAVSDRLPR